MKRKQESLGICGRCGKPVGAEFFEMMDTKDKRKERLCYSCGVSFGRWWRKGQKKK
jgi:hypothetical protein